MAIRHLFRHIERPAASSADNSQPGLPSLILDHAVPFRPCYET
jgi:hypothetical protein